MAINTLPTDFQDDIIDTAVNPTRRYNMTNNPDGTVSLEDVTQYTQTGSEYGAKQINTLNGTVNELIDHTSNISNTPDSQKEVAYAEKAGKLKTAVNINNVLFDGSQSITIEDDTKLSLDKDFILIDQKALNFSDGVTAVYNDSRIKANSLADVYFTADCYEITRKAYVTVDTYEGKVVLTAGRTPEGILTATIHIRVV